jgi:ArsR family transcriptional regulator, cadmium/lead-responsive transcriptional repressor
MEADRSGAVFDALSDPVRRRLLTELSASPATATALAGDLPISRQAVAKHLDSLARAGLLTRERSGREVIYRVTPEPLAEAAGWMMAVAGQWDDRLERLRRSLAAGSGG